MVDPSAPPSYNEAIALPAYTPPPTPPPTFIPPQGAQYQRQGAQYQPPSVSYSYPGSYPSAPSELEMVAVNSHGTPALTSERLLEDNAVRGGAVSTEDHSDIVIFCKILI